MQSANVGIKVDIANYSRIYGLYLRLFFALTYLLYLKT